MVSVFCGPILSLIGYQSNASNKNKSKQIFTMFVYPNFSRNFRCCNKPVLWHGFCKYKLTIDAKIGKTKLFGRTLVVLTATQSKVLSFRCIIGVERDLV
jgi:hypothetical protein